jgi:hypothetical protein
MISINIYEIKLEDKHAWEEGTNNYYYNILK